jgi:hypothetical protein
MKRGGEHHDAEQLGAGSGTEGVQALPESALEVVRSHQARNLSVSSGGIDGAPHRHPNARDPATKSAHHRVY